MVVRLFDLWRVVIFGDVVNMFVFDWLDVFLGWIFESLVYFEVNNILVLIYDLDCLLKIVLIGLVCKGF